MAIHYSGVDLILPYFYYLVSVWGIRQLMKDNVITEYLDTGYRTFGNHFTWTSFWDSFLIYYTLSLTEQKLEKIIWGCNYFN